MRLRRRDQAIVLTPTRHSSANTAACHQGRELPAPALLFRVEPCIPSPDRCFSCGRRQCPHAQPGNSFPKGERHPSDEMLDQARGSRNTSSPKDEDYTLMIFLGLCYSFLNFDFGIRALVIEIRIRLESRTHFEHIGVRRHHDAPSVPPVVATLVAP